MGAGLCRSSGFIVCPWKSFSSSHELPDSWRSRPSMHFRTPSLKLPPLIHKTIEQWKYTKSLIANNRFGKLFHVTSSQAVHTSTLSTSTLKWLKWSSYMAIQLHWRLPVVNCSLFATMTVKNMHMKVGLTNSGSCMCFYHIQCSWRKCILL
jgi:hypothetical protein